ncbi:DUF934 domain-containing protein [Yunchengibacter salinarum]|uniref:DUF934 domain-containing protein n=1 Tax=Yunchengibacter salinarum TaxID=3133399 RepID=UPI0035B6A4BC
MALLSLSGIAVEPLETVTEAEDVAEGARVAVPLAAFEDNPDAFLARAGRIGLIVETDTDFHRLEAPIAHDKVKLVLVHFPGFADGRGFSLAVRLRKDLGFRGEIRAVGHVIPDQAQFLLRAGFDSVEAAPEREEAFRRAVDRYQAFYQSDYTGGTAIARHRHNSAAPGAREVS